MPFYQRLGQVPRKRHTQFRDDGTLLTEEVFGLEGFSGNESILYHRVSPCRIKELGDGRWLRPGDVVEVEVDGIGVLRNRVSEKDM